MTEVLLPVQLLLLCLLLCADDLCLICHLPYEWGSSILRTSSSFNVVTAVTHLSLQDGKLLFLPFFLLYSVGVIFECLVNIA